MIQSEVFYFAKEPGVSKVNSKNAKGLLASLTKSKELTKKLFQIGGHFWSEAGEGELHLFACQIIEM